MPSSFSLPVFVSYSAQCEHAKPNANQLSAIDFDLSIKIVAVDSTPIICFSNASAYVRTRSHSTSSFVASRGLIPTLPTRKQHPSNKGVSEELCAVAVWR